LIARWIEQHRRGDLDAKFGPENFQGTFDSIVRRSGRSTRSFALKTLFLIIALCGANIDIAFAALDTAKIDEITGLKGKLNEKEGVYKVTFPRSDIKVSVDGWQMPPFMGLGTWAAFTETKSRRDGDGRYCSVRRRSELRDVRRARQRTKRDRTA
jgi:hypothetical protein